MWLPFTIDQFLDVFRRYNLAVWPAQWVLAALGVAAIVLAAEGRDRTNRWVSGVLALLWLWMAVAYHLAFFSAINRGALVFSLGFGIQGVLFGWLALRASPVSYRPRSTVSATLGLVLFVYALLLYPAIGNAFGHRYPAAPTFGVPCPTTIFTLGLIVWARGSLPAYVVIVPLLWSLVGTSAAISLGMVEDFGLLAAAVAVVIWVPLRRRSMPNVRVGRRTAVRRA